MKISEAISKKLLKICSEKNISVNKLANMCCLTQSTVQNLIEANSKNPKLLTIVRICDGLEMKITDFFDDKLFNDIDRED